MRCVKDRPLTSDFALIVVLFSVASYVLSKAVGNDQIFAAVHGSSEAASDVYKMMAGIWGGMLGFVIASMAIVIGFSASPRMKPVVESKVYRQLCSIFVDTFYWLLAAVVVCGASAVLSSVAHMNVYMAFAVAFVNLVCLARILRTVWALRLVTLIASDTREREAPAVLTAA